MLTQEVFIEKAAKRHNNKYIYSEVIYINSTTKVKIICPKHGVFEQISANHLFGFGCDKCAHEKNMKNQRRTTEEFIELANKKHNNYYDYSKVDYINNITKVKIICPKHGEFYQRPHDHLKGIRCKSCGYDFISSALKISKEEFIERSIKIHGDRYNYSKVELITTHIPVIIICGKHGEFKQIPKNHMTGANCDECNLEAARQNFARTTEEFIKLAKQKHGDKFDYSKIEYVNQCTKIIIGCSKHGWRKISPKKHLSSYGCSICGREAMADNNRRSLEEFIELANKVHNNKFNYSKSVYKSAADYINIICPIHGKFKQTAGSHLRGVGCWKCSSGKSENLCRKVLENLLGIKLVRKRPKDLINPKTNHKLEFDGYNEKHKIAFEYQGYQHYNFPNYCHRNIKEFEFQQYKDEIKRIYAKEKGIKLLEIKYFNNPDEKSMKNKILEVLIENDIILV